MFRLISIQQINDGTDQDPSNRPYRCTILSDDTSIHGLPRSADKSHQSRKRL